MKRSSTFPTTEIVLSLLTILVRTHLEYIIQTNCPCLKGDTHCQERTPIVATTWVEGLRSLAYEGRINPLKTLTLEKRLNTYPQVITQHNWKGLKRTALRLFHQSEKERTDLHTGSINTGTVCYVQSYRCQASAFSKNWAPELTRDSRVSCVAQTSFGAFDVLMMQPLSEPFYAETSNFTD